MGELLLVSRAICLDVLGCKQKSSHWYAKLSLLTPVGLTHKSAQIAVPDLGTTAANFG